MSKQTLIGWMFEHPWMTFFLLLTLMGVLEHVITGQARSIISIK